MTARMTMPLTTRTERTDRERHGKETGKYGNQAFQPERGDCRDVRATRHRHSPTARPSQGNQSHHSIPADVRERCLTRMGNGSWPGKTRQRTGRDTFLHAANRARRDSISPCDGRHDLAGKNPRELSNSFFLAMTRRSALLISSRLSVFGRCCCLVYDRSSTAQVFPVDIRAKFFTADGTVGSTLDRWATLCRYRPSPRLPLTDQCRRNTKPTRKLRGALMRRGVVLKFHAVSLA